MSNRNHSDDLTTTIDQSKSYLHDDTNNQHQTSTYTDNYTNDTLGFRDSSIFNQLDSPRNNHIRTDVNNKPNKSPLKQLNSPHGKSIISNEILIQELSSRLINKETQPGPHPITPISNSDRTNSTKASGPTSDEITNENHSTAKSSPANRANSQSSQESRDRNKDTQTELLNFLKDSMSQSVELYKSMITEKDLELKRLKLEKDEEIEKLKAQMRQLCETHELKIKQITSEKDSIIDSLRLEKEKLVSEPTIEYRSMYPDNKPQQGLSDLPESNSTVDSEKEVIRADKFPQWKYENISQQNLENIHRLQLESIDLLSESDLKYLVKQFMTSLTIPYYELSYETIKRFAKFMARSRAFIDEVHYIINNHVIRSSDWYRGRKMHDEMRDDQLFTMESCLSEMLDKIRENFER